jgi:hypothetical protein
MNPFPEWGHASRRNVTPPNSDLRNYINAL